MNIAVLGLGTVVPHTNCLANLVEQLPFLSRWRRLNAGFEIQPAVDHRERAVDGPGRVGCVHFDLLSYVSVLATFSSVT